MDTFLIKINSTDLTPYLKAPAGYSVNLAKLWTDAGRNMAGNLRSTFLGIFPKITLDFIAMDEDEVDTIVTLLSNPSFTVEWWNATTRSHKTGTFYAGDFDYAMHMKQRGVYDGFKVNLIAFNKMT